MAHARATGSLLAANVALNLALVPAHGARGAAAAFALFEAVAVVIMVVLYRRVGRAPRPYRPARLLLAGCAMVAVAALKLVPVADSAGPVSVIVVLGALSLGAYAGCLYALGAMPREVHDTLVAPVLAKLRRERGPPGP